MGGSVRVGAMILAVSLVGLSGCVESLTSAAESMAEEWAEENIFTLELRGHIIEGSVGELSHTRETEEILMPFQQVGWKVDIPESVRALEFAVAWDSPETFLVETHSHNHTTMQCCIVHKSAEDAENPKCIAIPTEDVMHGEWEPMVRTRWGRDVDFVLYVIALGGAPTLISEPHGHNRVNELDPPLGEGRNDEPRDIAPCTVAMLTDLIEH